MTMSLASLLLIILKKKMYKMPTSEDRNVAFFVQADVDATNCDSLVIHDSIVDSSAKGI